MGSNLQLNSQIENYINNYSIDLHPVQKEIIKYNEKLDKVFNDNPEVGTVGLDKNYTRLTFVCYLREKIANCPDTVDPRYLTKSGHSRIKD